MPGEIDPLYALARRVLLDALEALAAHRDAVILVGAHAIYVHVGEGHLNLAPYTTDGDVALNPQVLGPYPLLDEALRGAGFTPSESSGEVGRWVGAGDVKVDLLVPEALAGPGSRGARLPPHGNRIARRARGLEAVLADHQEMMLTALDPIDSRSVLVKVAGPSALLVAKLHKIAERRDEPHLQRPKDALDTYRLLSDVSLNVLAEGLQRLLSASLSVSVTSEALVHLNDLFGTETAVGSLMAANFAGPDNDPETIAASCAVLTQELLNALEQTRP